MTPRVPQPGDRVTLVMHGPGGLTLTAHSVAVRAWPQAAIPEEQTLLALELIDQGLPETLAQACAAAILERFTVEVRS